MAAFSVRCLCAVVLLRVEALVSSNDSATWGSLNDDVLLPYSPGERHGPSHSHRHVRDCQPVAHGNLTYETWRSNTSTSTPMAESRQFVSAILADGGGSRWVYGHFTFVRDPLRTLSVLEPGGPGGCREARVETVARTARLRKCLYAQNGGFFNMDTGYCLGNVVSDGKLVQSSRGIQNAQFGIRKDGSLVFGYLSEDDVLDEVNPFVQLVSGVVWLLRNGKVYVKESMEAECNETQKTGTFGKFVNVVSARTAVGHDREGRLVLFHTDGQTERRGMNLWQLADFLKEQGLVNAINLDGGGSSTFVANGSLASYPSDHCKQVMWRCPRRVSTVLCVHEPLCHPENCSGQGTCVRGHCVCQDGWTGPACDTPVCPPPACSSHGLCTQRGCVCDAGWTGENCSQACPLGFYGDGCKVTCTCANGATCDPVRGRCFCPPGFRGDSCEQECPLGFHGLNCERECHCPNLCPCDPVTGSCNITLQGERNSTLHRAGHCLAAWLFELWQDKRQEAPPYFSERTWIIISAVLSVLLLTSAAANVIQASRKPRSARLRQDYLYVPLAEMSMRLGRGGAAKDGGGMLELDDSDQSDST
ncbi:N-acetylglucosamine-1-phosphodiester alpha-N-acetylglucosaminidase isoform X1 [Scleropages formosus]|uniref:N-acetylglucosamine-1-phosphodiester alpha-N-acetylglucosaminidase n=1 Tax=Scleropages formosus TaxID=113540 RepID=A0A8C9RLA3_SCLFO|nr:N-acetylglucosamine-1-phosphodiester alpha-N-acetylglucosaminidase isoform X1 [Scleropages formosus]